MSLKACDNLEEFLHVVTVFMGWYEPVLSLRFKKKKKNKI